MHGLLHRLTGSLRALSRVLAGSIGASAIALFPAHARAIDLAQFEQIAFGCFPAISPSGSAVAYQVRRFDLASDRMANDIYTVSVQNERSSYVGAGAEPMWSYDEKYLSVVRGESNPIDLWVVNRASRHFVRVPGVAVGREDSAIPFGSVRWNPRVEQLGFIRQSPSDGATMFGVYDPGTNTVRVYAKTKGAVAFDFTPDGSRVVLSVANRLMILRLSDGALRLLHAEAAPIIDVAVSHAGDKVAYFSNNGTASDPLRPRVLDIRSGRDRVYGTAFPLWRLHYGSRLFQWRVGDRALLVGIMSDGAYRAFDLDLANDSMRGLTPEGIAPYWFTTDARQRLWAFMISASDALPDVAISPAMPFRPTRITTLNRKHFTLARSVPFSWRSDDGRLIEGLLMLPPETPRRPVPLVVVNEGTHGMFDLSFSARDVSDNGYLFPFQQQLFANQGWAVLMPNPRGSWGRGFAFNGLDEGDYGIGTTNDILSGINALAAQGMIDRNRVAIVGMYTDAYRAALVTARQSSIRGAVVMDGWYDLSEWYTEGGAAYVSSAVGGTPTTARERFDSISPVKRSGTVRATTLCITSEATPQWLQKQSARYCSTLLDRGIKAKSVVLPTTSWDTVTPSTFEKTEAMILEWLKASLKE